MAQIARFTLVRDVEYTAPAPLRGVPLVPPGEATPELIALLEDSADGAEVSARCEQWLESGRFSAPDQPGDHPMVPLAAWLRSKKDQVTLDELRESPWIASLEPGTGDALPIWGSQRVAWAESFVVAILTPDSEPTVAVRLHRLLLLGGLVDLVIELDGSDVRGQRDALPSDDELVPWAMSKRQVLLPPWLSRYPDRTSRVMNGLPRLGRMVREPAISDYYIVEDDWVCYRAAEIAHVENLLPGESKKRINVRETESITKTSTETEESTTDEKASSQTDFSEFSRSTQRELELSFAADLSVDTQGQYGPTALQTHLAGEVDGSVESAEQTALRVSKESVSRAVVRTSRRTLQSRQTALRTTTTDTDRHRLNNDNATPMSGVYRWVEQVRRLRVVRYPNRYLMEFLVPEPAVWWRWSLKQAERGAVGARRPTSFTLDGHEESDSNPAISAADVHDGSDSTVTTPSYLELAARYGATSLSPPPEKLTLATTLQRWQGLKAGKDGGASGIAKPANEFTLEWNQDKTVAVPAGWQASSWTATVLAWHDDHFDWNSVLTVYVAVGAGDPGSAQVTESQSMEAKLSGQAGSITSGTVPVSIRLDAPIGYSVNVEITCTPTESALVSWRISTYEALRLAYESMQREYDARVAAAGTRTGILISGMSPDRAREVERGELKKCVIALLRGDGPQAHADPWKQPNNTLGPEIDSTRVPRDELMFVEQAFEWENMRYVHYPYFWTVKDRWTELADAGAADPQFAAFLRAGSTRVVVPARPGFECAVELYARSLIPWGGEGAPAPDEPGYLSIAEEVTAISRPPPDGVQVGSSWEISLPTQLTCVDAAVLPSNAELAIPTPVKL